MLQHSIHVEIFHLAEVEQARRHHPDAVAIDVDQPPRIFLIGGADVGAERVEISNNLTHSIFAVMIAIHHLRIAAEERRHLLPHVLGPARALERVHQVRRHFDHRRRHVGRHVAPQCRQRACGPRQFLARQLHRAVALAVVEHIGQQTLVDERMTIVVGGKRRPDFLVVAEMPVSLQRKPAHLYRIVGNAESLQFIGQVGTQIDLALLAKPRRKRANGFIHSFFVVRSHRITSSPTSARCCANSKDPCLCWRAVRRRRHAG